MVSKKGGKICIYEEIEATVMERWRRKVKKGMGEPVKMMNVMMQVVVMTTTPQVSVR